MTEKRKLVTMIVTVSVPAFLSAHGARREVRHLINEQCNYGLDTGDVKVRSISAMAHGVPTE